MQRLFIDNKLEGLGGEKDYTRYLMDAEQFYTARMNETASFQFRLQDLGETDTFVVPSRGSYVRFEDDRWESRSEFIDDAILFTGYITDDPTPVFLGTHNGTKVWAYDINVASDDYLPQVKQLPNKIYVNRKRGFIIKDIVREMFKNADEMPIDVSGVMDGGTERLYQTDQSMKFADIVSAFANADGYRYRTIDSKLFYEPIEEYLPNVSDPLRKLRIDEEDPRFTPAFMDLKRVATSIVNDVTVFGELEPTTIVKEHWVSDGYQPSHQMLFVPFGVTENILIQDDFTAPSFDTSIWQEKDDPLATTGVGDGSYLQLFEGAFNVVGGPAPEITSAKPDVYLRSRRGIELGGIIETRDCEIYFPDPPIDGQGYIGAMATDDDMAWATVFSAWHVQVIDQIPRVTLVTGNGVDLEAHLGIVLDPTLHYIFRRKMEFDLPIGSPVSRRGPIGSDVVFGNVEKINGCWITFVVEEIDATDPQHVITKEFNLGRYRVENCPEFVLYAPVMSLNLHCVINFCKVWKPQQVRLTINGINYSVGDFIDGGVATVTVDNNRAMLQWYSIPTGADEPTDATDSVTSPGTRWNLGDPSSFVEDTGSGASYPMTSDPGIVVTTGSPSASVDQARYSPGAPNALRGPTPGNPFFTMPTSFTMVGWVKTDQANGGIFSIAAPGAFGAGYQSISVYNGRLESRMNSAENSIASPAAVNDGNWHHFAWTYSGGTVQIYQDGVLTVQASQPFNGPAAGPWTMFYDNSPWTSIPAYIESYLVGSLDQIAIYNTVLTADDISNIFVSSQTTGTAFPIPAYNPQTGVTIPPQGSIVELTYYRAEIARARLISETSIARERAMFGDDGIRQAIILAGDIFPTPRTSEECQYLAQAFLADREFPRYEGTYDVQTGERDISKLDIFPLPGELIPVDVTLANGERIDQNLVLTGVRSVFWGEGAYKITMELGPRNRFDEAVRKLLLARKSSIDNPEIKDNDILIAEIIGAEDYVVPADPTDVVVTQVTPLTFTVNLNPAHNTLPGGYGTGSVNQDMPDGVAGYEIRRDDTGWGMPNYVKRVATSVVTLDRGKRDKFYFARPFNLQNVYSRNSVLIRVISPLSNTIVAEGLDGDISANEIRLFIPIVRNPDIGGYQVQKNNSDGALLYLGDGITHRSIVSGATVYVESSKVTLTFPSSIGTTTFRVLVYNLVGEFGPETIFTVTRPAPDL